MILLIHKPTLYQPETYVNIHLLLSWSLPVHTPPTHTQCTHSTNTVAIAPPPCTYSYGLVESVPAEHEPGLECLSLQSLLLLGSCQEAATHMIYIHWRGGGVMVSTLAVEVMEWVLYTHSWHIFTLQAQLMYSTLYNVVRNFVLLQCS